MKKPSASRGKVDEGVARELLKAYVSPVHFRKKFLALKDDPRFPRLHSLTDSKAAEQARQRYHFLRRQTPEKLAELCQESGIPFDENFVGT